MWDEKVSNMARARRKASEPAPALHTWLTREFSKPVSPDEFRGERDKPVQTSLRLSRDAYDDLAKAAEHNGWGVGEEIRRRLEATFIQELQHVDEETHRLTGAIGQAARNINAGFGPWHQDRFSFDVFKAAINTLLAFHKPEGAPIPPSDPGKVDLYLGPDGTPETAGRMFAVSVAITEGIPIPSELRQAPTRRGEPR